ncbi:MAG: isochorismatase family protein [Chloroflexi bacterium]|nr:isochorismatase family protein [Chloroflexota bacterium]
MRIWDDVIPESDRLVYEKSGHGKRMGLGKKPALLIIDVNYNWTGQRGLPVLRSIERYPFACGPSAWKAVDLLANFLPLVRQKAARAIYTTGDVRAIGLSGGSKLGRGKEMASIEGGMDIVAEIAPQEGDIVIAKPKASAFFGTPLASMLNALGVDTLLCCGTSTSGCVRASVIDASSYNFRVAVIEECTFDRAQVPHKVNLFDMNAKYADVISLSEARTYLESL